MIKDFFLFFILGVSLLVLQSTWLYGESINPFRIDLLFILIIFLGTLNRLSLGLVLGVLLGTDGGYPVLGWNGKGHDSISAGRLDSPSGLDSNHNSIHLFYGFLSSASTDPVWFCVLFSSNPFQ